MKNLAASTTQTPQRVILELTVNGRLERLEIEPRQTLLEVLRDGLGLLGAKEGCGMGKCGACTVLLEGRPVNSCILFAVQAQGAGVVTIEGLARNGEPHPLQKAFVERGAVQCGFCTPGMILTAKALLDRNPDPDQEEIQERMSGNLCRCTGYNKIVEAVLSAAQEMKGGRP